MAITDIINQTWLTQNYLFGIKLLDDYGNAFPAVQFRTAIMSAIRAISGELDFKHTLMQPITVTDEHHDTRASSWESYFLVMLAKRPLLSVTGVKFKYGGYDAWEPDLSWVHVASAIVGQVQLIPTLGAVVSTSFPFVCGAGLSADYVPGYLRISYTAGFEKSLGTGSVDTGTDDTLLTVDGTVSLAAAYTGYEQLVLEPGHYVKVGSEVKQIESIESATTIRVSDAFSSDHTAEAVTALMYDPILLDCVGLVASLLLLDTAGDLIIGAGISYQSISFDGFSQSIGTTSGVENSGYGARAIQYKNRLKETLARARADYRRPNMWIA